MRVSSPGQLDFPHIHAASLRIFENMFPMDPSSFTHDHPLHEALPLATELNISAVGTWSSYHITDLTSSQVRKAILYSLVTTTDFDATDSAYTQISSAPSESKDPKDEPIRSVGADQATNANVSKSIPVLSRGDAEICMTLMTRFIEHFTPILFTPAATPHMACTDIFADTWCRLLFNPRSITMEYTNHLEHWSD